MNLNLCLAKVKSYVKFLLSRSTLDSCYGSCDVLQSINMKVSKHESELFCRLQGVNTALSVKCWRKNMGFRWTWKKSSKKFHQFKKISCCQNDDVLSDPTFTFHSHCGWRLGVMSNVVRSSDSNPSWFSQNISQAASSLSLFHPNAWLHSV